jgi:hypothetical protein
MISVLSGFLTMKSFVSGLLPKNGDGHIASLTRTALHGQSVYQVSGTFGTQRATFYVATRGEPFLLKQYEPSLTNGGTVNFSKYNKAVDIEVPKDFVTAPI